MIHDPVSRLRSAMEGCCSFRIRAELQDPLEQAAAKWHRPKAWIINEALACFFERENQDQRMHCQTLEGLAGVTVFKVNGCRKGQYCDEDRRVRKTDNL